MPDTIIPIGEVTIPSSISLFSYKPRVQLNNPDKLL